MNIYRIRLQQKEHIGKQKLSGEEGGSKVNATMGKGSADTRLLMNFIIVCVAAAIVFLITIYYYKRYVFIKKFNTILNGRRPTINEIFDGIPVEVRIERARRRAKPFVKGSRTKIAVRDLIEPWSSRSLPSPISTSESSMVHEDALREQAPQSQRSSPEARVEVDVEQGPGVATNHA